MATVTIPLALGSSQTGLTLRAQLVNTIGTDVGAPVTTGFVELGAGAYLWTGEVDADFRGGVVFETSPGGVVKATTAINPTAELLVDQLEALLLSVHENVLALLPTTMPGTKPGEFAIIVTSGVAYTVESGRQIDVRSRAWPDLTGADVRWWAVTETGKPILQAEPTVISAGETEQTVRLELSAVETELLYEATNQVGRHFFDATLASGDIIDLAQGPMRPRALPTV